MNARLLHSIRYPDPSDKAAWARIEAGEGPPRLCDGARIGPYARDVLQAPTCPACLAARASEAEEHAALCHHLDTMARRGLLTVFDAGTGLDMRVESVTLNGGLQVNLPERPHVEGRITSPKPRYDRVRRR